MRIVFDHIEPVTSDISSFWFRPPTAFRFIAGQYIEVTLPHNKPDSRGERRWLSISSAPHQKELLSLTMRFPHSPSSFKHAMRQLQPGTELYASDPIGDFVLPRLASTPVVLIAFGIGITPMKSMVSQMLHNSERRPLQLIHIISKSEDLIFREVFEGKINYRVLSSARHDTLKPQNSNLAQSILESISNPQESLLYLSGPEHPVLDLMDYLMGSGIKRQQIILDYFPGY